MRLLNCLDLTREAKACLTPQRQAETYDLALSDASTTSTQSCPSTSCPPGFHYSHCKHKEDLGTEIQVFLSGELKTAAIPEERESSQAKGTHSLGH